MNTKGLTPEEYQEWVELLKSKPFREYEQSEGFYTYSQKKWKYEDKLARNFLKKKNKKHF